MQDTDNKAPVEPSPLSPPSPVLSTKWHASFIATLLHADSGQTWHEASLQPPLSADSWVFWAWQWMPTKRVTYTFMYHATNGTGAVQTSHIQGTVPNGGTGYDKVMITVK